ASADTLLLKNGTKLEGKILKEDPQSYLVEVMVTKSIKEEKTIAKSDVAKIDRVKPDEIAFAPLAKLTPAPDLLSAGEYKIRISKLEKFIQEFPTGTSTPRAKAMLEDLQKEQAAVEEGGVKLNGNIIPASEREANKVELAARALELSIRAHFKASEFLAALREFSVLEKDYSTTLPFKESIPIAKQAIEAYSAQISEISASLPKRLEDRKVGLERMSSDDRNNSARAIGEQDAAVEKRFTEEKKSGVKWITPDSFHKASLDDTTRFADQELKRLQALKLDSKIDAGKAWRDAWAAVHGSDAKAVTTAMTDAKAAKISAALIAELETIAKDAGLIK
ncbi:MAG: hypothetical protein CFE26_15615, partial [Verrucomicrobiales bacterium VVV1]